VFIELILGYQYLCNAVSTKLTYTESRIHNRPCTEKPFWITLIYTLQHFKSMFAYKELTAILTILMACKGVFYTI
jgi:hypothetical protein